MSSPNTESSSRPAQEQQKLYKVVVIVLGDLGRSPRMMYHVQSLLESSTYHVTFLGYTGTDLIPSLQREELKNKNLKVVRFRAPKLFKWCKAIAPLLYFAWRIFSLSCLLIYALLFRVSQDVDAFLVQNPPAMPLLAILHFFRSYRYYRKRPSLIIDWHNLGYSMLPAGSIFRKWARSYETYYGPMADGHLTVTRALKDYLQTQMAIPASDISILHDCPPTMFRMRTLQEQHEVLMKINPSIVKACPPSWKNTLNCDDDGNSNTSQTLFTTSTGKRRCYPRKHRPALIVSSTSWTPDEDMTMLLKSLELLDQRIQQQRSSLRVVCAITGKGPLKDEFEQQVSRIALRNVAIVLLWLEPNVYPAFLACADLGISMHTSTSKMDLPIKILDYFGCEVPVAAYKFSTCLEELVQDDVNGRTFENAQDLSSVLFDLLKDLDGYGAHDFGALKRYSLQVQGRLLWSENWPKNAKPVIEKAIGKYE